MEQGGCQRLHLDVIEGNFVANITFGPVVIEAIRRRTNLYLEAHLMIDRPERYLHYFKHAGVNGITAHREACCNLVDALREVKYPAAELRGIQFSKTLSSPLMPACR